MRSMDAPFRCWGDGDPLMAAYHDEEWGVPLRGARQLFAKLILDGFQAGLSWAVVLHKRDSLEAAFDGFDPERMARYDARKIRRLLSDPGIIRNRQKIDAAIANARAFLDFEEGHGSFDEFLWGFVGGVPQQRARRSLRELPAKTPASERMSAALRRHGFRFVGSTICYAFMQAVGMVNDHLLRCFRHPEVRALARAWSSLHPRPTRGRLRSYPRGR